jgi:hypothetical protein
MHQSSAARGRWIVAIGALLSAASIFLQWWQIGGGQNELTLESGVGFSRQTPGGIVIFAISIAILLLLTLPFASEKPVPVDHWASYLALFVFALGGYLIDVFLMIQQAIVPIPPTMGPGFWVALVGLSLLARGIFELFEEGRGRLY